MENISSSVTLIKQEKGENKIIFLWSFTVWLVVMNTTMFNVALPSVLTDLSLSSSTASWIVSGYSIVFAISTLTYSRLSDFIPIGRLLMIGLTLLSISSIIGLFAQPFYLLLAARVLQAAGAGAVPGLAMVLAGRYIPISRRGRAMSFIASAASLGFGLGPVIGGAITQYFGWHYLFAVTGLVIFLVPLFKKWIPAEEVKKGRFDYFGAVLTGVAVTGFLLFLTSFSFLFLFGSLISFVLLWRHIHSAERPFIQPVLLKNKRYMMLLFVGFTAFMTHFSTLFLMPIMLSVLFGLEPAKIGIIIFPGAIFSAFAAPIIGRFIDRLGNNPLILFGHVSLLLATFLFAFLSSLSPYVILITYLFVSVGFSALNSSVANEISRILVKDEMGAGLGMAQLIQFFGGAFGVALAGLLLVWQESILPTFAYRNIYLGLTTFIVISFTIFLFYVRSSQLNK
nr:MFS transporter [Halalkalibacterium ligniniphilum]